MANKTTITNATINPMTNTCYVTYSTGNERMYPADKLPKTVTAWIEEHKVDEVEQIDDDVQTVQTVEAIETEATEETAETEQATEQLPAALSQEPEVRIKKPTLIDEMVRNAAEAEVKAMKEVIKEPEQAATQAGTQAAEQAAEPRRAVDWKEVMETTKQAVGRLCHLRCCSRHCRMCVGIRNRHPAGVGEIHGGACSGQSRQGCGKGERQGIQSGGDQNGQGLPRCSE